MSKAACRTPPPPTDERQAVPRRPAHILDPMPRTRSNFSQRPTPPAAGVPGNRCPPAGSSDDTVKRLRCVWPYSEVSAGITDVVKALFAKQWHQLFRFCAPSDCVCRRTRSPGQTSRAPLHKLAPRGHQQPWPTPLVRPAARASRRASVTAEFRGRLAISGSATDASRRLNALRPRSSQSGTAGAANTAATRRKCLPRGVGAAECAVGIHHQWSRVWGGHDGQRAGQQPLTRSRQSRNTVDARRMHAAEEINHRRGWRREGQSLTRTVWRSSCQPAWPVLSPSTRQQMGQRPVPCYARRPHRRRTVTAIALPSCTAGFSATFVSTRAAIAAAMRGPTPGHSTRNSSSPASHQGR